MNSTPKTVGSLAQGLASYQQGRDIFLKIYAAHSPCNTCPKPGAGTYTSRFPFMDESLTNVIYGHENFITSRVDNYTGFKGKGPFNSGSVNTRDGGQHMLQAMRKGIVLPGRGTLTLVNSTVESIDMTFGNTSQNGTREFDVLMKINNPTGIRFVEFKSLDEQPDIENKTPLGIDQFIGYLTDSRLTDLNGLLYVFNENKTNETAAKTMFQNIFLNPDDSINEVIYTAIFPKIPSSFNLDPDKDIARNSFKTLFVKNLNSALYKFVISVK